MITLDATETGHIAETIRRGNIEVQSAPNLEELTGADFMISPLEIPFAPRFLPDHIKAGALLVQRKSGLDLASSVGERMASSLARMRATGARQAQCVLMFIGTLQCTKEGFASIDGQSAQHYGTNTFWMIQSAIEKWMENGGVYTSLSRLTLLPSWLTMKERHVKDFVDNPSRVVFKSTDAIYEVKHNDPLQELILIKDWRVTLMSIPGLGPKKIATLLEYMKSSGAELSLLNAFVWLTEWRYAKNVPGLGKGIVRDVRKWLGLEPGMILDYSMDAEEMDER